MKKLLKKLFILGLLFNIFYISQIYAGIDLTSIPESSSITSASLSNAPGWIPWVASVWISLLKTIKLILWWVLLIFIVYTWVQMVMSMWENEEDLNSAKRQIRYSIIWLIFINIPGSLYEAFNTRKWNIDQRITDWEATNRIGNLFINTTLFEDTLNWKIIWFIEVLISGVAMFMLTIAWLKILLARWREEEVSKWKNKIVWSIIWLIFVWFIEVWQSVIYKWKIADWASLFETLANLSLFFAWPIAIIYLSIAWYYYVTSNGEEDKIKKAKSIVVNIIIATAIILASYTFLLDLATL